MRTSINLFTIILALAALAAARPLEEGRAPGLNSDYGKSPCSMDYSPYSIHRYQLNLERVGTARSKS